jgi:hypothetical protein
MLTLKEQIELKAHDVAEGLGITVWITDEGRIVQGKPAHGGTEIKPKRQAKPTPHGAPTTYGAMSDGD